MAKSVGKSLTRLSRDTLATFSETGFHLDLILYTTRTQSDGTVTRTFI